MIVVTTPTVPGSSVTEALGLVRGSSIRARHLGRDIIDEVGMRRGPLIIRAIATLSNHYIDNRQS